MSQAAASAGLQPPPNEGDADGVNVGVFVGAEGAAVGTCADDGAIAPAAKK